MRLFWVILGCFTTLVLSAQNSLKKTELSKDYFLADVQSGNAKLFSAKYQGACIVYDKKNKAFYLYGDANGTDIIFLEKIAKVSLNFNPDKFVSCTYTNGKVYLSSQVTGKATVITGVFAWQNESLVWEKEESYDLSEVQVIRGNDLIRQKKIPEAIATFDSVQYAETYFVAQKVGIEILLASVDQVKDNTSRRRFKESVDLQEKVLNFKGLKWFSDLKSEADLKTTLGKSLYGLDYQALQWYIESYVQNLLESRLYDKTIEKANFYWKYFTNSAQLLLNIADAWYAKKDKIKASEFYEKYTSQMKALKKEKEIPYYVPQRIEK